MRFLSDEWVDALVETLPAPSEVELTIACRVDDSDAFWLRFEDGHVTGGTGEAARPNLTFACDRDTMSSLSRNELPPQAAFMQGKLTITGDMSKLIKHQDVVGSLGPAMAALGATADD